MIKADTKPHPNTINSVLFKITCIFWLAAKLISWRIWTANRLYPLAPVTEILDRVPPVIHLILLITSISLLVFLFFKNSRWVLIALLAVELASCLLDQNRWRAWEYQYLFILIALIINANRQKNLVGVLSFILIATYFYSACGKFNPGFLQNVWGYMVLKLFLKLPANVVSQRLVYYSGYLLAVFELVCSLGLIFIRTRKTGAIALIIMHVFLLIMLGPLGLNYNKIVWPWNLAMIFYLYFIFLRNPETAPDLKPVLQGWNRLIFVFLAIMPALHFVGYWDELLSASMYSGKSLVMTVCIQDTTKCRELRPFYSHHNYDKKLCNGEVEINLQDWAILETNVTPNPELRIYKIIQRKLEKQYPGANFSYLIYRKIKGKQVYLASPSK
jgi:hypothetical protein